MNEISSCLPAIINSDTPLHSAVRSYRVGKINPVRSQMEHDDRDINTGNLKGDTPLHLAVQSKSPTVELAELLLGRGADVNVVNVKGETPLHLAVQSNSLTDELVELLLRHGADVNVVNVKGETPLHLIVQNKRCSDKLLELLLEHGADVTAKTPLDGNTVLHWTALHSSTVQPEELCDTVTDPTKSILTALVEHGINFKAANPKDKTARQWTVANLTSIFEPGDFCYVMSGSKKFVDILVEHGSDVNARNLKGDTPLHLAVLNKKVLPPVFDLLCKGSDVDVTNFSGDTPLSLCLRESTSHILFFYLIEILERTKCDINAVDSNGDHLLHIAIKNPYCAKFCFIKVLLDYGADIGKKNAKGKSALEVFCHDMKGPYDISDDPMLELLLQLKEPEHMMDSSLHLASLYHKTDTVDKLLRMGAYVDDKGTFGFTPLFYALTAAPINIADLDKKCATVKLLLHCGADVNHKLVLASNVPMIDCDNVYVRANLSDTRLSILLLMYEGLCHGWGWGRWRYTANDQQKSLIFDIYRSLQAKLLALLNYKEVKNSSHIISKINRYVLNNIVTYAHINKWYKEYLDRCCEELEAMDETELRERVSVLVFLFASMKEVKIYVDDEEMIKALHAKKAMFPIYQGMLDAKLAQELERRKHANPGLFSKILSCLKDEPSSIEQDEEIKQLLP